MRRLALVIALFASSGCSLMTSKEPVKADFDFGPLAKRASYASQSSEVHVPEAHVVVYDITAPAWMDNSSMYYRLAYQNAANPMPYAQSQWVMSPAALLTQRLRSSPAAATVGEAHRVSTDASTVYALRAELVEFEQIFDQPDRSRGVLRLRATLEGDGMWAQRTFAIEKAAPTADAAGGVRALTQCSDELAALMTEWVAASQASAREAGHAETAVGQLRAANTR
jgi:cholesterol transport system auxiliary component